MAKNEIPEHIMEILACPECKSDLEYGKGKKELVCTGCKEKFPVKDGIPDLRPKELRNG